MEVSPTDGTAVVLRDVSVLVVGPDFDAACAQEAERVGSLMKKEPRVFQGEPPTVDEIIARAQRLVNGDA